MIPAPAVLDDLLDLPGFKYAASHLDCEETVIEAYRAGAKWALDEAIKRADWIYPAGVTASWLLDLREAVDDE
jgi:hypothetical protein